MDQFQSLFVIMVLIQWLTLTEESYLSTLLNSNLFFSLKTRTNTFEMRIKQFNGNIMSLHHIASFAHTRDIPIESYWNRINCKIKQGTFESLNQYKNRWLVQKKVKICYLFLTKRKFSKRKRATEINYIWISFLIKNSSKMRLFRYFEINWNECTSDVINMQ